MFDHIGIKVSNLNASIRFYSAALQPLGFVLCSQDQTSAGFGPKDAPSLWLYVDAQAGKASVHLAFRARERKSVDKFHAQALAAGGSDHGAPGLRKDYAPNYYAAFLLDPDGHNIEAVCLSEG